MQDTFAEFRLLSPHVYACYIGIVEYIYMYVCQQIVIFSSLNFGYIDKTLLKNHHC